MAAQSSREEADMPAANPSAWKETLKDAVADAMKDVGVGETLIIDKIEVRKKSNPIHEYRIWLAPGR
jgi:hypothetical protein